MSLEITCSVCQNFTMHSIENKKQLIKERSCYFFDECCNKYLAEQPIRLVSGNFF